jgi:pimeloyl-ACP methyl ester carboxylesterase
MKQRDKAALVPSIVLLAILLAAGFGRAVLAQTESADANPARVVTVERGGYTISALVTHLPDAGNFKHAIALFPGNPGIMRIRAEDGQPRFEMGGNFLVRSRRHWLDAETLVAVIDAPSDQWDNFSQSFRATARYGADVEALLAEIGRSHSVTDWTLVGTSEGSVSVFHAARMNPGLARRAILTASLFRPSRSGSGLSTAKLEELPAQSLWVHHVDDPCPVTPYRDAQDYARRSGKPLLSVRGGSSGQGKFCMARTAHGFIGIERETVLAMRSWVKTGVVPPDVKR